MVNLKIKGVDSENDFFTGTVDSISIPLSNYQNTTPFSFTKEFDSNQENEDLIYFNYVRNNVYISRSCGYKMEYEIENIIIENDNLNWIEDSIIEKRAVNDEISHHVKIYH